MTNKHDGGPAFPTEPRGTVHGSRYDGMSLRDWFAGQALAGMMAHSRNGQGYQPRNPNQHWHSAITEESYEIADAMLEARK